MTRLARPLLLLGILALCAPVHAEEPALDLGDVTLRLGTPEDDLLPQLRERYTLAELRPGLFRIAEKEDEETMHGLVQFRDGKLDWVSRDRGVYEGEGAREFARALFVTLARMNPEDGQTVELTTHVNRSQKYEVGTITLRVANRELMVYVGDGEAVVDVSMEEILTH